MRFAKLQLALILFITSSLIAADAAPALKVIKTLPLGGEGRWDYLCADAQGERLYVPRSTHVQVVDLESGKLVGDVPNTQGVHGVALAPEQNLGFSSNGRDNSVSVFDLKTLKETKRIKAGKNPDAIMFDPASKHIFAFNHSGGDVTVIDPAALDSPTITIPVGGALEFGVNDGAGHVFVNVEDKGEVVEIDSKENKVLAHWPLEKGATPTGLAIDLEHHRLFAGCGSQKMYVLDSESGKLLGSVKVGNGVDGAGYDATLGAMTSNGRDGTISLVRETSPGKFEVVQTPKTFTGARTMTIDAKTHHALLPCNIPDGKGGQAFGIVIVGLE